MVEKPPLTALCIALPIALSACSGAVDAEPSQAEAPRARETHRADAGLEGRLPPPPKLAAEPKLAEKFACDPAKARLDGPRVWRLTAAQYNNTITRLLGLPQPVITADIAPVFNGTGESVLLNSSSALRVQEGQAGQLRTLARNAAAAVAADPQRLEAVWNVKGACPATPASYKSAACADTFVRGWGGRAFRRPLEPAEADALAALFALASRHGAALDGGNDVSHMGVRAVIEAVLQSPSFLYRAELPAGTGRAALSPHQLAVALSYTLTDNMPDAELFAAAERNELQTSAQVAAQARRVLEGQGRPAVAELFHQWLNYEELETRDKDEQLFPQWSAVKGPMDEELARFVGAVVFDRKGGFRDLFEANFTFANKALAPLYGARVDDGWKEIATNPVERAGLLTLSGLMAHSSVLERTSPVTRGLLVQERLFCTHVPDPPGGADLSIPPLPAGSSRRQQLEVKTAGPLCLGCHGLMNGIGFGLENLDAIGRYRDKEDNGVAIDARGEIKGTLDSDGSFTGPRGLATALVKSQQTKECFTLQAFRYALGRPETAGDACSLRQAYAEFVTAGHDVRALLVSIAATEAFRYRQVP